VPLLQGVMRVGDPAFANYAVSQDGTLVYATGSATVDTRALLWVDREGREEPIAAPLRTYTSPRISPDGRKVALNARDQDQDIWIWDTVRETLTRLTFDPGQDRFPLWSPDGERIAYSSQRKIGSDVSFNTAVDWQAADGTGMPERLAVSLGQIFPTSFSPDAAAILVYGTNTDSAANPNDDIAIVRLEGEDGPTPLLATTFGERMPDLSPDGHWLAYVSDESGQEEVYVRPFPDINAGRWQVSTGGGTEPLWARDGTELFYRNGDALYTVPIQTDPRFEQGNPQIVFQGRYYAGQGGRAYDVSSDGRRFLMLKQVEDSSARTRIVVVLNWFTELERLAPTQ
jgi:eukaryotic-like serine/threonine-protein kinase